MMRRLFTLASLLPLLFCGGTTVLSIDSRGAAEEFVYTQYRTNAGITLLREGPFGASQGRVWVRCLSGQIYSSSTDHVHSPAVLSRPGGILPT